MKIPSAKRVASAVLVLGIAASGFGLTAGTTVLVRKKHLRKYKWEIKTSVTTTTAK
jgi:hypothetical protein